MKANKHKSQSGFSTVELLVVVVITSIMTSISLYYLYYHEKLYKPDEQAAYIIDILQEARQRALTQKTTMRVELDLTDNVARLINEETSNISTDDTILRSVKLKVAKEVTISQKPNNITTNPVEPSPVPIAEFKNNTIYPPSLSHRVATIRFRKDGTVTDAGTNDLGGNANITGVTIYVWQPDNVLPENSSIARAITIIGSSGAIRLWNYYPDKPTNAQWKDSRRFQ